MPGFIWTYEGQEAYARYWPVDLAVAPMTMPVVVAVPGGVGDWAAYMGVMPLTTDKDVRQTAATEVAAYGYKLPRSVAVTLFLDQDPNTYRD